MTRRLFVAGNNNTHIGVIQSHGLPVQSGRFAGGFVRVDASGAVRFTYGSGSFPRSQLDRALGHNLDDLIRGVGARVSRF